MNQAPKIGVGVVVRSGKEILLLKRQHVHGSGTWATPGGHLEYGEDPIECAHRETKEETGVEIRDAEFIGVTNDFFVEEEEHYITLWVRGEYGGGQAEVRAEYEMSDVGWFSVDELPDNLFLSLRNLLGGQAYHSSSQVNLW